MYPYTYLFSRVLAHKNSPSGPQIYKDVCMNVCIYIYIMFLFCRGKESGDCGSRKQESRRHYLVKWCIQVLTRIAARALPSFFQRPYPLFASGLHLFQFSWLDWFRLELMSSASKFLGYESSKGREKGNLCKLRPRSIFILFFMFFYYIIPKDANY